jgi:integrase
MALSYDVHIWAIRRYVGARKTTYTVRWSVAGKAFPETFGTKALAEAFRAQLVTAAKSGEAFDTEAGLPVSMARLNKSLPTWYQHATAFVDMKWPRLAPKSRAALADSLATVTAALTTTDRGRPDPKTLRGALANWAFNTNARTAGKPKDEYASAIAWIERNSVSIDKLAETTITRAALDALTKLPSGDDAAATTVNRKRFAFHQALEYAVEVKHLPANPLDSVKWRRPRTTETVDRRSVVNPAQGRALLDAVRVHSDYGARLEGFFALLYFAGLRPGEALDVHADDLRLPKKGWGEVWLSRSNPQPGKAWTDDGAAGRSKALKHRARGEGRAVPLCPELVVILRRHLADFGTAPDGRLFWAQRGGTGLVCKTTYAKIWREARSKTLGSLAASPLGRRPYDLRHACLSTWLNAGVPATQVAEWAGHSVDVLLRIYAKCLDGTQDTARRRIEDILNPKSAEQREVGPEAPGIDADEERNTAEPEGGEAPEA